MDCINQYVGGESDIKMPVRYVLVAGVNDALLLRSLRSKFILIHSSYGKEVVDMLESGEFEGGVNAGLAALVLNSEIPTKNIPEHERKQYNAHTIVEKVRKKYESLPIIVTTDTSLPILSRIKFKILDIPHFNESGEHKRITDYLVREVYK